MRTAVAIIIASVVSVSGAAAQATGFPSFNAPYRAFSDHEAGFAVSFPGLDDVAVEGLYRFGRGKFDIGFRGGVWFIDKAARSDEIVALGVEARQRILTHSDDFPADGALIIGAGIQVGAIDNFISSIGVSFGRRVDIEDSDVSIIPYVQPNLWWFIGDTDDVLFSLGLGADFRLSPRFDLRVSVGVGDIDGLSVGAVW
ncbi:MAG: hypothetical protein IH966_06810, partial [Gemmatimonadetes bacterium]|nr:hypothetical protein [Gemmatimonadota bacterium]